MSDDLEQPQIRVILDVTALTAYARLTVGELIATVEEDDGLSLVGIPVSHFMAAHWQPEADERTRLISMVIRPAAVTVLLPMLGTDTLEALEIGHVMGQAVIAARRSGAYLATYDGDEARRYLPGSGVLDLLDK
ncbi:hypothetical protein [Catellatospora methionotrophica]|uniref:hypothetical protein n=1 Tax=Catellatospora methionotrophica TaxID=121620 RepID=UPI0033D73A0C